MKTKHLALSAVGVLVACVTTTAVANAQTLERRPYIQRSAPSETTIVWTTTSSASSVVHYGSDPTNLNQTANGGNGAQHEVRITGLSPDTRYFYDIQSGNNILAGGDANHYFETAASTGTTKKFRMWVVGDSGTGGSQQAQVRDAMLSQVRAYRPHLYLHVGDMAYGSGTTQQFTDNFFTMYEDILRNTVVWPAMGNHEGQSSTSSTQTGPYYDGYVLPTGGEAGGLASGTEAYYSFDYANVHFVVLDSHQSPRNVGGAMLTWMQQDLQATGQDWIIAFWHHPPYTKGSHNSDTEGALVDMRENALPILEAAGVDMVLGGHSHIYERSFLIDGAYDTPTVDTNSIVQSHGGHVLGQGPYSKSAGLSANEGAIYIVAGHGGTGVSGAANHPMMYFSEVQNGSVILDVQDNRLAASNIRYDGTVTDSMSLVKGTAIVIGAPDGGETLAANSTTDIQWATVGNVSDVRIEYSFDDGGNWNEIVASTPNTGSYGWTVPVFDTLQGLVRVSSVQTPTVQDESNAGFIIAAAVPEDVIVFGDSWRYDDSGTDHGNAWLAAAFDDSGWGEGPGQLGYGDGDEATALNGSPVHPSYYFRKSITLSGTPQSASIEVLFDDGVVVWVNGTQLFDRNAGNGVGFSDFASASSQENEIASANLDLTTDNPFVEGDNIVTAMVKQRSGTSSDVSFDMKLTITIPIPPPPGTGGSGGMGGANGAGGAGTGSGAGAGAGSAAAGGAADPGEDEGCSCSAPGGSRNGAGGLALALLGASLLLRRRRR